jgi:endonuclease/exonuclease/phosphatase family metal-dependent hydrolase
MLAVHIKRWSVSAALALIALVTMASASGAEPQTLRLMTYNIRLDLASDGVNAWSHRRDWVAAQILWLRPDIFGLQEVLPNQKVELIAALPRYRLFGSGRDGKDSGESSPVGFDTGRFDFREGGTFWLSPTPDVPSRAWDAAHPRTVTWVRLRFRDTRADVLALNTHWDHIGIIARRQSAAQIIRWIESNARPCEAVVVFGDFNSTLDSEQMRAMRKGKLRLRDARAITKTAPFGPAGTFNAFNTAPARPAAIDHILIGERIDVERYAVFSQVIEGRVPSDHFPVLADLRIASCR